MELEKGGSVCYFPDFLGLEEHLALLTHLTTDIKWERLNISLFGKSVILPRLQTNMADPDFELDIVWFNNHSVWTPMVYKLKQRIEALTGRTFSYAHLGYYTDEKQYLGYHTDDELHDDDIIVSISLGATRRFVIRERYLSDGKTRNSGSPNYEFSLKGGSMFIFDQLSARDCYKHSIPKCRKVDRYNDQYGMGRVNITFREK